jgi:hypothetical protein
MGLTEASCSCRAANPFSACDPLLNAVPAAAGRWVALATRTVKNCTFYEKSMNAFAAGASAVLIGNDLVDSGPVPMDYTIGMPAVRMHTACQWTPRLVTGAVCSRWPGPTANAPIPAYSIGFEARNALEALTRTYSNRTDGMALVVSISLQHVCP